MPPIRTLARRGCVAASRARAASLLLLAVLLLLGSPASATRLMSWNLLNYPVSSGDLREDDYRAVIGAVAPDLIACQEVHQLSGAVEFRDDVLDIVDPGEWVLASFNVSTDTERALYYRASAFTEIDNGQLATEPRYTEWWRLRPAGYTSSAADLYVYVVHLKASQGSEEESRRFTAAQIIREHLETLPAGANFVVCGDFNIYDSGEPAWAELTGSQIENSGRSFDPISRVGDWHNTASFADVHSQSTRTTHLGDGGATGGMDDRFDFILANDDLLDDEALDVREQTYVTYGQDGLHFNANVNDPPTNAAVGQTMADHLQAASDHLPLYVDLQLPAEVQVAGSLDLGQVLVGGTLEGVATLSNPAVSGSDELDAQASIAGGFSVLPTVATVDPGFSQDLVVSVDTTTPASLSSSLVISSDAVDEPVTQVAATASVVSASEPSLDPVVSVVSGDLDFGEAQVGEFVDLAAQVHNLDHDALQSLLQVHDAQIGGTDAGRFSTVGFAPVLVGSTPATVTVSFDDTGASEGTTYTATLTLLTRDDPAVAAGQDRTSLTVALSATVTEDVTATPEVAQTRTRLLPNVPNPFNPRTTLRFELARSASVRLEILDLRGRRVRTLLDRLVTQGSHEVVWLARDDRGRAVSSGSYLLRLTTPEGIETRSLTLLR